MKTKQDALLTQTDLSDLLQISVWTLWSWRRKGLLPPAVRIGNSLRWRKKTVESWLDEHEVEAAEFDSARSYQAEKASAARKAPKKEKSYGEKKRRGRPSKIQLIEARKTGHK